MRFMRHLAVGTAVIAALISSTPRAALAQQASAVTYGFSGGLLIPSGTLGDINGSGINIQAQAGYKPSSLPFGVRADFGIWTTGGKTLPAVGAAPATSYKGSTWVTLNANVVYNFESEKDATFVPYVIGGLGVYSGGVGDRQSKFGINAGGGVTFKLSSFDAFAEARIHNVFTDGYSSRLIPLSFGINFKP
jgi:hypothetical protein